jgi:hypothetical protein
VAATIDLLPVFHLQRLSYRIGINSILMPTQLGNDPLA